MIARHLRAGVPFRNIPRATVVPERREQPLSSTAAATMAPFKVTYLTAVVVHGLDHYSTSVP